MNQEKYVTLMDADRIHRSLNRMAHEMAEKNTDDRPLLLVGIDERGFAVARSLSNMLKPLFEHSVEVIQLDSENEKLAGSLETNADKNLENYFIITVDDVIFSGQTMFGALKKIVGALNPSEIHTAVLIDRGHRRFPIQAEFCGMELPTKLDEHVSVVVEGEAISEVKLLSAGR